MSRKWTAWPVRLAMACGVTGVLLLGAPASAHTDLISVDPADGSRLDGAPGQLVLEFSEEMNPGLSTVTLTIDGGDSTRLEVDQGRSPSTLVATVPAPPAAEPGDTSRWRAAFRVVSADGHPVAGKTSFIVSLPDDPDGQGVRPAPQDPETQTATSSPEPDKDEDGVPWLLIATPVAVLGVLALVVVAVMRLLGRDEVA
ncbi:copper resistance protein CopC [Nocardioides pyridinolyticus]